MSCSIGSNRRVDGIPLYMYAVVGHSRLESRHRPIPPGLALAHYGGAGDDRRMKGAGIREIGGQVQLLELPDPPNPKPDE
ncbi:MAG: hypothetical protein WBC04_20335, partial [Candidatus Acidiferrales bacterium]